MIDRYIHLYVQLHRPTEKQNIPDERYHNYEDFYIF